MNQEVNLGVKREIKVIPVDLVQEVKGQSDQCILP